MSATNEAGGYADGRDMTIQFAPAVKPAPIEAGHVDEIARSRRQSVVSIPHVVSEQEKDRREIEKNLESKHAKIDEHLMLPYDVGDQYKTRIDTETPGASQGLTAQQADRLLAEHGRNVLTPPKKRHPFMAFLDCLRSLFNLLLILAGFLEYILLAIDFKGNFQNTYLGAILIIVAFLNAFIEFYQQQKSQALLESFMNMIPTQCMCIRDAKVAKIEAASLVPGDVVLVRMGDKTPADLFVFSANDCKVDNSALTGESLPQDRSPENDKENFLEASNIMFNGTLVVSGEAYGIVIRTGDATVLGQIAGLTAGEDKTLSPLAREIDDFVKIIATIAIVTGIVFFGISFPVNNNNASLAINFAITMFVAWVPEGLPATVTILLSIAAKRMAARNVLVKDLRGVETLGAITLLATDKTGTLTRNRMAVANIWTCGNMYDSSSRAGATLKVAELDQPGVEEMIDVFAMCSHVRFDRKDVPIRQREILGDATESGFVRYAIEKLPNFEALETLYPKIFELPFNSETKWHMTIHKKAHATGPLTLYIKGAPERIWRLCEQFATGSDGSSVKIGGEHQSMFDKTYDDMASRGHRVLGFAEMRLPGDTFSEGFVFNKKTKNYPQDGYTFLGLGSLEDPPKHGVREAIGRCRSAGIKVMMVTGDHPLTAEAIARKINLMISPTREMIARNTGRRIEDIRDDEYKAIVIHGEQIDNLSDVEWDSIMRKDEIIFARTSPKHKLEIVRRAQGMGHIVAVTGDGVNDSPALKKADLGIAMNHSGSDVSKEAASMILLDDNFASTVHGIEEGRLIFTNLKKSIKYTISHSTPEVIPTLLYVVVPLPLPLTAILVLVIDLGFELFAGLSYAWDPPETQEGLMKLPPRKPVTADSINAFRRRALRDTHSHFDEESGVVTSLGRRSRSQKLLHNAKKLLSKSYWLDKFDTPQGEVLVDFPLLSWAYLEIGLIETVCSLVSFFLILHHRGISPHDAYVMQKGSGPPAHYWTRDALPYNGIDGPTQVDILAEAQSMYYWSIMTMQMFNLFACKTRLTLPFGRYMFANRTAFYCIAAEVALAAFIVYTPGVEKVFGTTRSLSPLWWLVPLGFGLVLLGYATARMVVGRLRRPVRWNPEVSGLQMFPTIRTFRSLSSSRN